MTFLHSNCSPGRTMAALLLSGSFTFGLVAIESAGSSAATATTNKTAPKGSDPNAACEPIQTFSQPPAGFDPTTATAAELAQYGFPPFPPGSNAIAIASWTTAVQDAKQYSAPTPICGTGTNSVVYSDNWSGHVVPYSVQNNAHFTWSTSTWTQPSIGGDPSYTNYQTAPTVSFWTGTGVSSLIQTGASSIATSTPQYRFWTEDYPNHQTWEGPVISPNDTAYVYEEYEGSSRAYYYLENETTGDYQSFTNSAPYDGWAAANYIGERIAPLYLPAFGPYAVHGQLLW
jgi:hypothetical protein